MSRDDATVVVHCLGGLDGGLNLQVYGAQPVTKPFTDLQWRTLRAFHDEEERSRYLADPEALARRQALERRMIACFREHAVPVPESQLIVTRRRRQS